MSASPQIYAAPFDAVAERYDETFTSSKIGQAQRAAVLSELAKTFRSGDRVLEIGCGTGVDACFLAKRGVRVVASDSSAQMIAVATRRVLNNAVQEFVQPLVLRAEDIATLPAQGSFDGAFSNFGALNCLADLRLLSQDLARLLRPGATALLCWMGPCCLWEMVRYSAHGKWGKAFRRINKEGVTARIADRAFVRVRYPSVRSLARTFAPEFRLKSVKGIGVAVPPSYLEDWAQRHPRVLQFCERADFYMGRFPGIRALADHILLHFERKPAGSAGR
ncbi:MAG TPA: methyltransferase domain-containing protein [Candidatus Sulfotelmatobacter sp.]